MGIYAEQIAKLKLVRLLEKCAGRDEVSETDVLKLHASVLEAADIAGPLLERIPVTFKQYTEHNLGHSQNLISLMGKFIPEKTQKRLNALEISVLILAAILHDIGMFVTEAERDDLLNSKEFERYLDAIPEKEQAIAEARAAGKHVMARVIEDAVLADYFRKFHPERAWQNIEEHLGATLRFKEYSLVDAVSRICESHGWGVFESTDVRRPENSIANLKPDATIYDVPFNEQYIAAMLRLADIMDFDRSRTPLAILKTIDFTETKSQAEWEKHLQIKGWRVTERDVVYHAECRKPEHYVAVMDFLEWIDAELRDCRRLLVRNAPKEIAERYLLHLPPAVDRIHVEMADKSFIAGAFRFELDYERIMNLLMDRSLYPDPSLFLRELLQNSLDACRVRIAQAKFEGAETKYDPRITVWDRSKEATPTIVFQDNGVGMSRATVEKYFMRVGRSYYRSNEFHAERKRLLERGIELEATSQFGIGFLSCFMVADRIEIETYRYGHNALRIEIEGATKYFTIKIIEPPPRPEFLTQGGSPETDGPPAFPGTRITLYLRLGQTIDVKQTLETFGVNIEVPTTVIAETAVPLPVYGWRRIPPPEPYSDFYNQVASILSDIVVPLEVPLHEYDFCEDFDGHAWFWMLRRTDGLPQPRVGCLQISHAVQPYGQAAQFARFAGRLLNSSGFSRTKQQIDKRATEVLGPLWTDATQSERDHIVARAKKMHDEPSWFTLDSGVTALHQGGDAWRNIEVDYRDELMLDPVQRFALHGVALPAGITRWTPMAGVAERLSLFSFALGFQIDVWRHAPRPAANRLFMTPDAATKTANSLTRVFIRHVLRIWDESKEQSDWHWWVEQFVGSLRRMRATPFLYNVLREERVGIETRLLYRVHTPEGTIRVSMDELKHRFGRWAPWISDNGSRICLAGDDPVNSVLLLNRSKTNRDHVTYVDLESEVEPK